MRLATSPAASGFPACCNIGVKARRTIMIVMGVISEQSRDRYLYQDLCFTDSVGLEKY
jgi:hypothetical protein